MAQLRTPRAAWIESAMRALASGGPAAVRVETLARDLGVSKGGFYWHFEDRRALLEEMLEHWQQAGTEDMIATVDHSPDGPREKLRRLFGLASSASDLFAVELALRDWARRDPEVAARLRQVDNRRMEYLRAQFSQFCGDPDEVEVRALLAYSLLIGTYFLAAEHGGRSRAEAQNLAVDHLLGESPR